MLLIFFVSPVINDDPVCVLLFPYPNAQSARPVAIVDYLTLSTAFIESATFGHIVSF